jgi:hypothetical protein
VYASTRPASVRARAHTRTRLVFQRASPTGRASPLRRPGPQLAAVVGGNGDGGGLDGVLAGLREAAGMHREWLAAAAAAGKAGEKAASGKVRRLEETDESGVWRGLTVHVSFDAPPNDTQRHRRTWNEGGREGERGRQERQRHTKMRERRETHAETGAHMDRDTPHRENVCPCSWEWSERDTETEAHIDRYGDTDSRRPPLADRQAPGSARVAPVRRRRRGAGGGWPRRQSRGREGGE